MEYVNVIVHAIGMVARVFQVWAIQAVVQSQINVQKVYKLFVIALKRRVLVAVIGLKKLFYDYSTGVHQYFRFWDGFACFSQRTLNETCLTTIQCSTEKNLNCQNGKCS